MTPRLSAQDVAVAALAQVRFRRQAMEVATAQDADRALADPVWFFDEVLTCGTVWPKMKEMLEALRDNDRTSIVGCTSSSKDYTMGRAVLWWLYAQRPSKVIITGPTQRQISDVVWRETREAFYAARRSLPGRILPVDSRLEVSEQHFAMGFATDRPFSLQGFHSPHLLIIVTEAQGFGDQHMIALKRLNPEKIVLTGNPLTMGGEFYDSHHGRGGYATVSINAFDTPNLQGQGVVVPGMVTEADVAKVRADWGEDSPEYVATILGRFPDNLGGGIVPSTTVNDAIDRSLKPGKPSLLAVDVAGRGLDRTVAYRRDGGVARIAFKESYTDDLSVLADRIHLYLKEHPVERVVVDAVGIGFGLAGNLRKLGVSVEEFVGGASAREGGRFVDRNAEAWWRMREAFLAGELDIENDVELLRQLTSRQYNVQGDKRVRLQPKEQLAHSPDEADALAMTFSGLWRGETDRELVVDKAERDSVTDRGRRGPILVGRR